MLKILRRPEQFWETLEAVVTVETKKSKKVFSRAAADSVRQLKMEMGMISNVLQAS